MKIKELIADLQKYDPELDVGIIVSVTDHSNCGATDGGYCYCRAEDRKLTSMWIEKEKDRKLTSMWIEKEKDPKTKNKKLKQIWIRGDY